MPDIFSVIWYIRCGRAYITHARWPTRLVIIDQKIRDRHCQGNQWHDENMSFGKWIWLAWTLSATDVRRVPLRPPALLTSWWARLPEVWDLWSVQKQCACVGVGGQLWTYIINTHIIIIHTCTSMHIAIYNNLAILMHQWLHSSATIKNLMIDLYVYTHMSCRTWIRKWQCDSMLWATTSQLHVQYTLSTGCTDMAKHRQINLNVVSFIKKPSCEALFTCDCVHRVKRLRVNSYDQYERGCKTVYSILDLKLCWQNLLSR